MDRSEFSDIRRYLGKSQAQIARLLGVSPRAVQSFEQGWRSVPVHTERQLLFLLFIKLFPTNKSGPCWEKRKCNSRLREKCPAWEFRAGHICWFINGTICDGKVQDNWSKKMQICRKCEVFKPLTTTRLRHKSWSSGNHLTRSVETQDRISGQPTADTLDNVAEMVRSANSREVITER